MGTGRGGCLSRRHLGAKVAGGRGGYLIWAVPAWRPLFFALYQHLYCFFQVPPSFGQHPLGLLHRTGREYLQECIYSRQKFFLSTSCLWARMFTVGPLLPFLPQGPSWVPPSTNLILGVPSSSRRPGLFFELFGLPQGLWKNGHLTLDTGALWVQVLFKRQRGYRICQGLGWGWASSKCHMPKLTFVPSITELHRELLHHVPYYAPERQRRW